MKDAFALPGDISLTSFQTLQGKLVQAQLLHITVNVSPLAHKAHTQDRIDCTYG